MAVPLADLSLAVDFVRQRAGLDLARPRAQAHGATQFFHTAQFAQLVNHAVRRCLIELAGISVQQPADVAGKLDACRLHAQANSEIWDLLFARILNRLQHALDAAFAEPSGDEQAVIAFQLRLVTLVRLVGGFETLRFDPVQFELEVVRQ